MKIENNKQKKGVHGQEMGKGEKQKQKEKKRERGSYEP